MSEFLINEAKQFRAAERSFGLDCFVGARRNDIARQSAVTDWTH
jgi:hypothetical protein